jgi:5-formyltetrahydrofolate cyclo-ligase
MTDLPAEKRAARAAAQARRAAAAAAAPPGAREAAAARLLAALEGAAVVSAYLPIRDEADPLPAMAALHARGVAVCVPVVEGRGLPLRFRLWRPGCALVEGPFGVRIPAEDRPATPGALAVPLLAFDRAGFRLGYGGGFYDRTLTALRAAGPVRAVGFARAAQEVAAVPRDDTDARLDLIVTEAETIAPEGFPCV